MLSEQNQKLLEEQFSSLPVEIQETILESNWKEVIRRITEKYALHIDQGGALETIVFLTMLGLEEPANFTSTLKEEVRITESLALAITKEVEEGVFQKIRQDVMRKQNEPTSSETEAGLGGVEGVDIIDEEVPTKDPYREIPEGVSHYTNGQHLDNESILKEIENGTHPADGYRADIEVPKEVYKTKDVNILDSAEHTVDITEQEGRDALASVLNQRDAQKPDVIPAEQPTNQAPQEVNPLHIRTLKSDILRQKLENPSWTPDVDTKTTNNTKDIIEKASREALTRGYSAPEVPSAPQAPASTTTPQTTIDPYRETF